MRAMACGFILAVLFSFTGFSAACGEIQNNVLRLHVMANSDGENDQRVKLLVRDAILKESAALNSGAESQMEAVSAVCTRMEALEAAANRVLSAEGVPYRAKAEIRDMYFTTRQYEDFRLPAGKYRALRITLGEGAGKNWWCVVYPSLCLSGASSLKKLPEDAEQIVAEPEKFEVKFKAAEWFSALLEFFDD